VPPRTFHSIPARISFWNCETTSHSRVNAFAPS
jgi:hypothetical protein